MSLGYLRPMTRAELATVARTHSRHDRATGCLPVPPPHGQTATAEHPEGTET